MFRARFFLFLCALCLLCSVPLCEAAEPSSPAAAQDASPIQQDESVQGIWEGIMSTRLKQLKRLQSDVDSFQQMLGEKAAVASQNSGRAREEYEKLSAIAEVSRNMPAELTDCSGIYVSSTAVMVADVAQDGTLTFSAPAAP